MIKEKYNVNTNMLFSWITVLIWMIMIFIFSSQPATESGQLSQGVTHVILKIIGKIIPLDIESSTTANFILRYEHLVRKFAHGAVYLVFGVLVTNAFLRSGVLGLKVLVLSLVFCMLYAVTDEIHQLFVLGRSGQFKDVLIDSVGAITGMVIYGLHRTLNQDE